MSDYISTTLREGSEAIALAARPSGPQAIRARGDRRRRRDAAGLAVAALAVIAAGASAYPLVRDFSTAPSVADGGAGRTVPRVAGDTLVTAERAIVRAGLSVGKVTLRQSDAVPAGLAIRTSPRYGTAEHGGARVSIVLSAGTGTIVVPNATGMTERAGDQLLLRLPLEVEVRSAASGTAVAGTITGESPAAGTAVPRGSIIVMYVEPAKHGQ